MGHEVVRVHESDKATLSSIAADGGKVYDFCLFNKWYNTPILSRIKACPRVFWFWDLVASEDHSLAGITKPRQRWMKEVLPVVDLGFCTDGDWVAKDKTGKLVWLTQGADERVFKHRPANVSDGSILFVGNSGMSGNGRKAFVQDMKAAYGDRFIHYEEGLYGTDLSEEVAKAAVVVAPDSPVTDRYWSNRVYGMLARWAFLLHPYSFGLAKQYTSDMELTYYTSREQLHSLIDAYSANSKERERMAWKGYSATVERNTYRHRCEELVKTLKERLL